MGRSAGLLILLTTVAYAGEPLDVVKDARLAPLAGEMARAQRSARGFLLDTRRYPMSAQALRGWRRTAM